MSHFLQSPEWQDFQKKVGRKTFRTENGTLVLIYNLFGGMRYAYVGGAPAKAQALEEVKQVASRERAIFLKWETMEEGGADFLKIAGFRKSPRALQPQQTSCINLTKDEDVLLASMHHKTRYNIGVAKRRDVQVNFYKNPAQEQKEMFRNVLQETAARDGFRLHDRDYYFFLCDMPGVEIAVAEAEGQIAAAHLMLFPPPPKGRDLASGGGDKAIYLHGGSRYAQRSSMAPYLLHWATMQEAKNRGYKVYDFWGIDEKRWPGLTRFKEGFGGEKIQYIGSWDYVLSPIFYAAYRLKQKMG